VARDWSRSDGIRTAAGDPRAPRADGRRRRRVTASGRVHFEHPQMAARRGVGADAREGRRQGSGVEAPGAERVEAYASSSVVADREANVATWRELRGDVFVQTASRHEGNRAGTIVPGCRASSSTVDGAIEEACERSAEARQGECLVTQRSILSNLDGIAPPVNACARRDATRIAYRDGECRFAASRRLGATSDPRLKDVALHRRSEVAHDRGTDVPTVLSGCVEVMIARFFAIAFTLALHREPRRPRDKNRGEAVSTEISLSGCGGANEENADSSTREDANRGHYRLSGPEARDFVEPRVDRGGREGVVGSNGLTVKGGRPIPSRQTSGLEHWIRRRAAVGSAGGSAGGNSRTPDSR